MPRRLLPQSFTAEDDLQQLGSAPDIHLKPVIRCLVWNIYKAKHRHWQRDFMRLVSGCNLVLLQESIIDAPTDGVFIEDTPHEWIMARSYRQPLTGVATGVKTGCTAVSKQSAFYFSPHTEPLLNTQKLLLVTRYALADEVAELLVLNMHSINFVSTRKYVEQLDQITLALGEHKGPVILAGDFNTWNPARLGHFLAICETADMTEARMQRTGRLAQLNQHLDHVFYRGLTLRSIESLAQVQSSDHAPISVTFVRESGSSLSL